MKANPPSPLSRRTSDDPTPMYHRIRRDLEEKMLQGSLRIGDQLPTEQELCTLYSVSRITARKALVLLHKAGIIERNRGRGSFVVQLPGAPPANTPPPSQSLKATEIGIIYSGFDKIGSAERDDWWAATLRALESKLLHDKYHLTGLPPPLDEASRDAFLARLDELGDRLAALIFLADSSLASLPAILKQRGVPWVSVNRMDRQQTANFVAVDNHDGGCTVGRLFAQLGYAPVLVVGPSLDLRVSTADKFFGFMQGYLSMGRSSCDVRYLECVDLSECEENTRLLREQLQRPDRPRAIFCVGDILAATVLRLCQELRLSVPGDLAVVGGTGLVLAEHTTPPLTLLAQPKQELGYALAEFLLEMIRTGNSHLPGRFVLSPLIGRESCPTVAPSAPLQASP